MSNLWEIYKAQFRATITTYAQYQVGLFIWLVWLILEPVIYLVAWSTVALSHGGSIDSLTTGDFAAYFLAVMFVNQLTFTWGFWQFEGRVRQGELTPLLLRPTHPIHADIVENASYKLLMLVAILPVTGLLMLAFQPTFHANWWTLLFFLPAVFLAAALRFAVEWTLGLLALWITRINGFHQFYSVALLFLAGRIAPLSLFPPMIQQISMVLPFRWMIVFPVELLTNNLSLVEIIRGLAILLLWLSVSVAVLQITWRTGIRRYSAVGA